MKARLGELDLRALELSPKRRASGYIYEAVTLGDRIVVMTAHPGRIKAIVEVPFPRPRQVLGLRRDPAYGALVFRIWGDLRDEVDRARRQEAEIEP